MSDASSTHSPFGSTPSPSGAILTHRLIHRGRKFDFEMVRIERAGRKPLDREMVRHPGAVVVVAWLDQHEPAGGPALVLIRNTRWALAAKDSAPETLWECCAGTIERDARGKPEEPLACAKREIIEETGYEAADWTSLGWFFTTPGMTDERMHAFFARGLTHVGQKLEEDEAIKVEVVPLAKVWAMIDAGELRDAKSMLAIMLAERRGLLG
jgi:ADP-ribose pyrophosphatase